MDPYLGEIRLFAGNYAPVEWLICDGSLVSVSKYSDLYSLIGNRYGGDTESFALPDLRGRTPMHYGGNYNLAQAGGSETVTLTSEQLPQHKHAWSVVPEAATSNLPYNNSLAYGGQTPLYSTNTDSLTQLSESAVSATGANHPHENMQPYVVVNFIICTKGTWPPRPKSETVE